MCCVMQQTRSRRAGRFVPSGMEGCMRKVLGLVGATLLFAGPALAADLGRPPPLKAAPLLPVFSWTGLYLGVHGGYGWARFYVVGLRVLNNFEGGFAGRP